MRAIPKSRYWHGAHRWRCATCYLSIGYMHSAPVRLTGRDGDRAKQNKLKKKQRFSERRQMRVGIHSREKNEKFARNTKPRPQDTAHLCSTTQGCHGHQFLDGSVSTRAVESCGIDDVEPPTPCLHCLEATTAVQQLYCFLCAT